MEHLSRWLLEKCKHEHLSLRQTAAKTGLSHATIADSIKGVRPLPETIRKLAQGFGGDGTAEKLALRDHLLVLAGYREEETLPADYIRLVPLLSPEHQRLLEVLVRELANLEGIKEKVKLATRLLIKLPVEESGPLAQLAEQVTLNHQVTGSTPVRLTILFNLSVFNLPTTSTFVIPLLKNQSDHAWPAGFFICAPESNVTISSITDNANETSRSLAILTKAPLTLPEYMVEVML